MTLPEVIDPTKDLLSTKSKVSNQHILSLFTTENAEEKHFFLEQVRNQLMLTGYAIDDEQLGLRLPPTQREPDFDVFISAVNVQASVTYTRKLVKISSEEDIQPSKWKCTVFQRTEIRRDLVEPTIDISSMTRNSQFVQLLSRCNRFIRSTLLTSSSP